MPLAAAPGAATNPVREILPDPEADEAIRAAAGTGRPYVVRFASPSGSEYGSWFSVDHKGGSFLCRPAAVVPARSPEPVALAGNALGLPAWTRIDAAVETPDGVRYFFDNAGGRYAEARAGSVGTPAPTAGRFGRVAANLTRTGVVNAVLRRGDRTYVFSGSQYLRYSGDPFGPVDTGYPAELATNTDGFPRWPAIDAAFTDLSGTEWFCAAALGRVVRGDALDKPLPVTEVFTRFGVAPFGTGQLDAAFVDVWTGATYLFSGPLYVRCSGGDRPKPEKGYPKPLAENSEGLPRWTAMGAALRIEAATYYFDDATQTYLEVPADRVPQPGHGGTPEPDRWAHPTQLRPGLTPRPSRELAARATTGGFAGVDAAYVEGSGAGSTVLYVTSGDRFARYTLTNGTSLPAAVDEGYPKPLPVRLTAIFRREAHRYAFSGRSYTRLRPGVGPDRASGFRPIEGNWADLPADFAGAFTGLLDSDSDHCLYLFLAPTGATSTAGGATVVGYPSTVAVPRPFERVTLPLEVVRLTTSTAAQLNRKLLTGGVASLLEPASQELDELPAFRSDRDGPIDRNGRNTIAIRGDRVASDRLPTGDHLDFASANGIYYWEIFFHAPMLIAGALNDAQRFAEARQWYEYVFDPTEPTGPWRFLPFLAADLPALAERCRAETDALAARLAAVDFPSKELSEAVAKALADLATLVPAFRARRTLTPAETAALDRLAATPLPGQIVRADEYAAGQYTRSR
ncbi:MAG: hemopexin repeat-containing protein, partial [Pseudonocardia sp.]